MGASAWRKCLRCAHGSIQWRKHHFHARMAVEEGDEKFFVRLPRAAGKEGERATREYFNDWQIYFVFQYVGHSVETGVAGYFHVCHADGAQQRGGLLVLHEQGVVAMQHFPEQASVRAEKHLRGAENRRNDIGRNRSAMQFVEVVAPKFVFHEDSFLNIDGIEEATHFLRACRKEDSR